MVAFLIDKLHIHRESCLFDVVTSRNIMKQFAR
jgi:hypothetical protein